MASRTGLWQAVKKANPCVSAEEVDALVDRAVTQERELVLKHGLNLDQARELSRSELFPNPAEEPEETQ
jgi:hypothetical protein